MRDAVLLKEGRFTLEDYEAIKEHAAAGERIVPIEARILAAADSLDAMTQDRSYQRTLSWPEAIAEIRANRGTQFDPEVADALVDILVRRAAEGRSTAPDVTAEPADAASALRSNSCRPRGSARPHHSVRITVRAVTTISEALGEVGLPAPVADLARREWDAIVVGGGHNGLTAAAYLAKAGRSVLVLERRERLGGACTLERPFGEEEFVVSPCAYVVGLLDERVIAELGLRARGYEVFNADPNLWCPFPDGTSYAEFLDDDRTRAHMRANGFAEREIEATFAYDEMFDRLRRALRGGPRDTWEGASPGRAEIEELLEGDDELISVVFEESIAETLDRYFDDERLKHALFGQGIIGVWAGPETPGTTSVKLMHNQGRVNGEDGVWGYVKGGMGQISFLIAEAAAEAGATLAAGVPVSRILPGEGVELESGEVIRARAVISNADPKRTLAMLDGAEVDQGFRRRIEGWDVRSPVVKVNAALRRLPTWSAAGEIEAERAMITVTRGPEAASAAFEACERGEPAIGFCELYFQTAYDPSTAPPGRHTMSCFCQYGPYELADGDWESRRDEVGQMVLDEIAAYAPDIHDCVDQLDVLGPPEIESRIGLTGGNIFQGSVLPEQMWDRRLAPRTPVEGLFLCGAATHPGGSVIGLNGRNAAFEVLAD